MFRFDFFQIFENLFRFRNCSISELFRFKIVQFQNCSISELFNLKIVQFQTCSILKVFNFKFVQFQICSIPELFHFRIVPFKICSIPNLFNFEIVPFQICSNLKRSYLILNIVWKISQLKIFWKRLTFEIVQFKKKTHKNDPKNAIKRKSDQQKRKTKNQRKPTRKFPEGSQNRNKPLCYWAGPIRTITLSEPRVSS
jgi:hypothetical protein